MFFSPILLYIIILSIYVHLHHKGIPKNCREFISLHFQSNFTKTYAEDHIPGAVLFNMDAAYYPSQYIRFDLYPPREFEKYVRLLGVNAGDHVVVYSRDKFAGMMWAARVWWTFKVWFF
ncbi:hypothetical protein ANCDUO_17963 [Ancylostoma duodenale]|uniref:Rhodanese domain-containing protein n=1 Tax=Ancylostoma duodenale TaxID=51022 RepID=A0A0C2CQA2_9BILA|nr:hypothetical protein ANCDUO_17963 [Ancylostoma duodenale]